MYVHLWSEKYDRGLDDIFAIQDEIALAVTEKLKVTLLEYDLEQITKPHKAKRHLRTKARSTRSCIKEYVVLLLPPLLWRGSG
jgi:hypothetical protein